MPFTVADNYTHREDLLVGNSLFQNKVVEINYDKQIVIIRDTMPELDAGYSRHELILVSGTIPFIQGSFSVNDKIKTGWFMFDTGAYTTILSTNEVSGADKTFIELKRMLGINSKTDSSQSPGIAIGNYAFSNFNYVVEKANGDNAHLGLLGNDLLKRFNVVVDNRNGYIYLRPNSLANEKYANPEYHLIRIIAVSIIAIVAITVFIVNRKKIKKKLKREILS